MTRLPTLQPTTYTEAIDALLRECGLVATDASSGAGIAWIEAKQDDQTVGVVALQRAGSAALLRSLGVVPKRRHCGIGASLVAAAERAARHEGLESLYLLTEGAHAYFTALGYQHAEREEVPAAIHRLPQFAGLCPASALCMTKRLR
ncbi:arsenic resistance N-acetyltransferase ArsN2 [Algiphilus sp.]|uniref:arsenic resistance N-acetyltransferase ArsN2 n=1 Tax=Algiphilus sp. TaxID=1872431 RepID=UPI003C496142